ncbi:MAG: FAD-dependent oxidoreductase [Candidatus Hadarchaeaceae archaeon]
MAVDLRIKEHPILEFKRGPKVKIYFRRKKIDAYEGETIGAALYAAGVNVFTRSIKYHRPRGMFCAIGKCSSCMMRVNGVPNVKTCVVPVIDGMRVEPQNCFPSANHDFFNIMDRLSFALSSKSYFHLFARPRFLNALFLKLVWAFTGVGNFPSTRPEPGPISMNEWGDTEVAVIGGGPAGLSAAINAAKLGCRVTLIDENNRLGGQLIKQTHMFFGSRKHYAGVRGIYIPERLAEEVKRLKNIEVLLNASAFGIYEGNVIPIVQDNRYLKLRAKRIIVSTGAYERTLIFENNDLPGVMGAGGVQTLMNVYGIKPGNEALMVGAGNVGLIISYQLLQAGVKVKGIVEAMPRIGGYFVHAAKIRRMGVPIYISHTIKRAWGRKRVKGATIVQLDERWKEVKGTERNIKCDLICVAAGLKPTYELLYQAGCDMRFIPQLGGHVPLRTRNMETTVKGLYIPGDAGGIEEADTAMVGGKIAGLSAALSLGYGGKQAEELREEAIKELEELRSGPTSARIRDGIKKALIGEG